MIEFTLVSLGRQCVRTVPVSVGGTNLPKTHGLTKFAHKNAWGRLSF